MFWRKVIVESHSQVFKYSTQRHLYLTTWEEVSTINYLSPEIANFNITPENPELSVSQFLLGHQSFLSIHHLFVFYQRI